MLSFEQTSKLAVEPPADRLWGSSPTPDAWQQGDQRWWAIPLPNLLGFSAALAITWIRLLEMWQREREAPCGPGTIHYITGGLAEAPGGGHLVKGLLQQRLGQPQAYQDAFHTAGLMLDLNMCSFFLSFFIFLGPHPQYMEVSKLGVESEL